MMLPDRTQPQRGPDRRTGIAPADGAEAAEAARGDDLRAMATWLRPLASEVRLELLRYLRKPHYLEEIASHLGLTRQAARRHLDQLVAIGALDRRPGRGPTGSVTEFVTNVQTLFRLHDDFERLGSLRPAEAARSLAQTLPEPALRYQLAAARGPTLTIVRGLDTGTAFALDPRGRDAWVLGRDPGSDVPLAYDPFISTRHAIVRLRGGSFVLADLASRNGTLRNWRRIPAGGEAPLRHGDVVGVGRSLLVFWERAPEV